MHRSIEVTLVPSVTPLLLPALQKNAHVLGITQLPGASVKPAGDVLHISVLNRGAGEVLQLISETSGTQPYSIVTAEVASIIDRRHRKQIQSDVDEAIWEEVETGLRHNGRLTANFMLLMAMGGIITAVGFSTDPQNQVIAFIAASIIAPGLEPLAKIPLGIVLRKKECLLFGLRSTVIGYLIIIASAMLTYYVLTLTGDATKERFLTDTFTEGFQSMKAGDWFLSGAASASSILMYLAYRRNVIAGPLIALVLIPAAVAIGLCCLFAEWKMALDIAGRFALEVGILIGVGMLIIYLKQKTVHRRRPLI